MTEYIKRDAAVKIAEKYGTCNGSVLGRHSGVADIIASMIDAMPAADVSPVVHARWIYEERTLATSSGYRCSACRRPRWLSPDVPEAFKYCPKCGAKMDGGVDDETD